MPKPRNSMYSESVYSQSSCCPSITPSLLNSFPTPPDGTSNPQNTRKGFPPLPVDAASKLAQIKEEQAFQTALSTSMKGRDISKLAESGVSTTSDRETRYLRRRSASFSCLSTNQKEALSNLPSARAEARPTAPKPKSRFKTPKPPSASPATSEKGSLGRATKRPQPAGLAYTSRIDQAAILQGTLLSSMYTLLSSLTHLSMQVELAPRPPRGRPRQHPSIPLRVLPPQLPPNLLRRPLQRSLRVPGPHPRGLPTPRRRRNRRSERVQEYLPQCRI
jgi:hypothetical protein